MFTEISQSLLFRMLSQSQGGIAKIEKLRRKKLACLLEYAWDHSKFYREFYSSHGIKRTELSQRNIEDLPVVNKKIIIENIDNIFTCTQLKKAKIEAWLSSNKCTTSRYLDKYLIVHTSGSSGNFCIFAYSNQDWQTSITYALLHQSNFKTLLSQIRGQHDNVYIGAIFGHFTGVTIITNPPKSIPVKLISILDDKPAILSQLQKYQTGRPLKIWGYPSIISDLYEWSDAGKLSLNIIEFSFSAEAFSVEQYKKIKLMWPQARIIEGYNSTEGLVMAYRKKFENNFKINLSTTIIELLDDEFKPVAQNEPGRVTLTNLHNFTTPLIRYQIGDGAISSADASTSRLGVWSLQSPGGRTMREIPIVNNDNKKSNINPHVLSIFIPGIAAMQYNSQSAQQIDIHYVANENIDALVVDSFMAVLKKINADKSVRVNAIKKASIPREKGGKKLFVKVNWKQY